MAGFCRLGIELGQDKEYDHAWTNCKSSFLGAVGRHRRLGLHLIDGTGHSIKVLELRKEVLGERHPDTIESMVSLVSTYHQQGRSGEAEEINIKVLELRKEDPWEAGEIFIDERLPSSAEFAVAATACLTHLSVHHDKNCCNATRQRSLLNPRHASQELQRQAS